MIQAVPQLLFTVHMKKIKYTHKNENGVPIPARDYAKHFQGKSTVFTFPDYSFKEYKVYRNVKVK